jgi:tetratricopeptide (TPR) repeat protein/tRNA A-37 threonylcarbamoyl transferase component Bud32
MGLVYEAEQRETVRRRVALKVMKPGLDTREVIARFEAERQALAVMEHPGIAHVLDAGETIEGRPFFVMELVHGEPLKDYADAHKLPIEDRLELFIKVCRAVQHAHVKGVVHRDLKPSNILVEERDGIAQPKVIDFGVAKATGQRLTEKTLVTQFGQALGTPAYMSPEQAEMSGLDVDTRTDVYSLGVTLYELLIGRLPTDPNEVGLQAFMAGLLMRESDPPTPSTRYSTLDGKHREIIAGFRRTDPGGLHREVRGDLDWIVMKAMEKDRERRYETADSLAMDLERYLREEPVLARPPSSRYRAAKFVRRHRAGVAMAAALAVLILAFAGVVSAQAARLARARDQAELEALKAGAVNEFMEETLLSPDPMEGLGKDVTVREALDAAVDRLPRSLDEQPGVKAAVLNSIGTAYHKLGNYEAALPLLESSYTIRRELHSGDDPEVAESLYRLAALQTSVGDYDAADSLFRSALAMQRRLLAEGDGDDDDVATTLVGLGNLLASRGDYEGAAAAFREALDIREREPGDSLSLASLWDQLGTMFWNQGEYDDAELLLRQSLAVRQSILGDNPLVASSMNNLAVVLDNMRDYAAAEPLYRGALDMFRRLLGPDHDEVAAATLNLAILLDTTGQDEEAERLYFEALELDRKKLGDDHPFVANDMTSVAGFLCERDEALRGVPLAREAVDILSEKLEPGHWHLAQSRVQYGFCLTQIGAFDEAERQLLEAVRMLEEALGSDNYRTERARARLNELYEAWGRTPDPAAG